MRIIDPTKLLRDYVSNAIKGQVIPDCQRVDVLRSTLITGAAALCNELANMKSQFSWNNDFEGGSIVSVILQTIKEIEVEFDCINPDDNNDVLVQSKRNELLNEEKILGHPPISFLLED